MNVPLQVSLPSVSLAEDRTLPDSRWFGFARTVSGWPKPVIAGLLLGLVIAVGGVDYLTGVELSVSLLYLIPMTLGTWVAGRSMGNLVALASAGVWFGADLLARQTYGHWFLPVWNTLTLAMSFLVLVALLASLREANEGLEQTVTRRTKALQAENAQRRQAEEELRHALGDVRTAHAELQRTQFQLIESAKMESVGRLAAGVAHEVKNPLMTLSLGVDYFLNRRSENPNEVQLVQDMKEAVHRASNVINVLLDYARPRPLRRAREDIHEVTENSLALVRHQLNKHHVAVVREFDATLPPLSLDRTRIEHVFVAMNTKRILVVDDEPSVTRNLKLNLESGGGYEVFGENQATNALTAARNVRPDLILLDVMMPGMDGGDVAARLRADPLFRDTPIIFLTAIVSNEETDGHEMISGAETFLPSRWTSAN